MSEMVERQIEDLAVQLYVEHHNIVPGTTFAIEVDGDWTQWKAMARAALEADK